MSENYCMVRTKSAGVFAGTLEKLEAGEAMLTNARRIWYWSGAATLSQLATEGTKDPENCKFPCAVPRVFLREVIEVIEMSAVAKASIEGVPVWAK